MDSGMRKIGLVLSSLLLLGATEALVEKMREAAAFYEAADYQAARDVYLDAQLEAPDSLRLQFNLGNACYKIAETEKTDEDYLQAISAYQRALETKDKDMMAGAYYNIGNARFRLAEVDFEKEDLRAGIEKCENSILSYQEALRYNPDDEEARENIEVVRKKIAEVLSRVTPPPEPTPTPTPGGTRRATTTPTPTPTRTPTSTGSPGQPSSGEGTSTPTPTPVFMTKEQALQLLDNLEQEDRERKPQPPIFIGVERDW